MKTSRLLLSFLLPAALIFPPLLFSQYQGGDFVNQNEKADKGFNVETDEELVVELQKILELLEVGEFPRRKTECLKYKEVKETTENALKVMRKVVPVLPSHYRIVVIGNADKRGKEVTEKGEKGNDYWSAMRAKCVADFIISQYPESGKKILMGGQGSKINRRVVTFEILPEEKATKVHEGLIRKFKW